MRADVQAAGIRTAMAVGPAARTAEDAKAQLEKARAEARAKVEAKKGDEEPPKEG